MARSESHVLILAAIVASTMTAACNPHPASVRSAAPGIALIRPETLGYSLSPRDERCLHEGMVRVPSDLAVSDLKSLVQLMRTRDSHVLNRVERTDTPGEIYMETGTDCGFTSGDGYSMVVRRKGSGWEVLVESRWES
jgi:hypothetical protein